jgi:hypothetical protein
VKTSPPNQGLVTSPTSICVLIDDSKLWEIGDFGDEKVEYLISGSLNKIDDILVEVDRFSIFKNGPPIVLYDKNEKMVGSLANGFSYCSKAIKLAAGNHQASIAMKTRSGKLFLYSWRFQVN